MTIINDTTRTTAGNLTNDPRRSFGEAARTAQAVVSGVRPDQLALATVCETHDVRSLLGHMLIVFRRITALGNGTDPMAMPDVVTGIADDGWVKAFVTAAGDTQAAWADSTKLQQTMELPWATAPGAAMLGMYTSELTVHTWDLAQATGQRVDWHQPTIDVALASALRTLPSGDREAYFAQMADDPRFSPELKIHPPFRNAVPVPADASALDRLIGWYGRKP
jgi:uncharacterized protein (TIGR03086 family)